MKSSREISGEPQNYSNGVLIGNWLEQRVGKYQKNPYRHITIYAQDYNKKKVLAPKKEADDIRTKAELGNMAPSKGSDEVPNYYDNFSTIYDLSFQYFPKWIPETLDRKMRFRLLKFEPTDEYLNGFGNLSTRLNLTNDLKEEWGCDVLDPRRPVLSIVKTDYTKMKPEAYLFSKWPRLRPYKIQTDLGPEMVYSPLPPTHPRMLASKVNPITWEGADQDPYKNCMCKT